MSKIVDKFFQHINKNFYDFTLLEIISNLKNINLYDEKFLNKIQSEVITNLQNETSEYKIISKFINIKSIVKELILEGLRSKVKQLNEKISNTRIKNLLIFIDNLRFDFQDDKSTEITIYFKKNSAKFLNLIDFLSSVNTIQENTNTFLMYLNDIFNKIIFLYEENLNEITDIEDELL
jgi:hypothetical protein